MQRRISEGMCIVLVGGMHTPYKEMMSFDGFSSHKQRIEEYIVVCYEIIGMYRMQSYHNATQSLLCNEHNAIISHLLHLVLPLSRGQSPLMILALVLRLRAD